MKGKLINKHLKTNLNVNLNSMKKQLLIAIMATASSVVMAQNKKSKWQEVHIQTSVTCEDGCGDFENIVEDALNYVKGVKYAEIDRATKIVTVKYNSGVVTPTELRKAISEVGYDADDVKANPEAIKKLPFCCQPESKNKH
jgi:mercuric ion binding protein